MAVHLKKTPSLIIATGFGSGLIPLSPGTIGSIVALIPFIWIPIDYLSLILLIILGFLLGLMTVPPAEKYLGSRKDYRDGTRKRDQQQIVIDEFVGMWISLFPIAIWPELYNFFIIFSCFVLFRIFDIFKPLGIKWLDNHKKLKNEFGVMFDDVVAGLYSAVFISICYLYFPDLLDLLI